MKHQKLVVVSASALTAGLAHGAIQYTYFNQTVGPGTSFNFDLNQDGFPDYTEQWDNNNALKPYISDTVGLTGPTTPYVLSDASDDGGNSSQGLPLTAYGAIIDDSYEQANENGYFYQDVNNNVVGGWNSGGTTITGYVGLELDDNDGNHFGWAQFTYNSAQVLNGVAGTLTLVDCAMETAPDTAIAAGENAEPGSAPVIVIAPVSETNAVLTTAQLKVIATANPPPTYQWMSAPIGSGVFTPVANGGNVSGATSNVLTIANLTTANSANYVVEISNANGSTVNPTPATILVQPLTITSLTPSPLKLYSGEKASITANYSSSYPITSFQWQKNGAPLSNGGDVSGTTSSNLVIGSVSSSDSANYSVVIANSYGSVTSVVDSVTVHAPGNPYELAVVALKPVAYYNFNETNDPATGKAVAFDRVGGFNGIYGAATQNGNATNDDITGPLPDENFLGFSTNDTAVSVVSSIEQSSSIVTIPALNLNTNAVTFLTWINPQASEANYAVVISFRSPVSGTANGLNYSPSADSGGLGYHWNDNGNTYNYSSGLVPPPDEWSLVALTISSSNAVFYMFNAEAELSATNEYANVVQAFNTPGYIGGDNHDPNFIGDLDEVAIFNQTLSQAQLANLYNVAVTGTNSAPMPITLNIQPSGSNVVLTWPQGTLWQATSMAGPWTSLPATSPYTIPASGSQMFFRVQ